MRVTFAERSEMISMFEPGVRRKVSVLRNQRTQNRYELGRPDVLYLDNLCNDVVGSFSSVTAE